MILYISVFVITLLLSKYVITKRAQDNSFSIHSRQNVINVACLAGIFVVLTAVSVFRVNTGNDYNGYINKFHDAFYNIHVVTEPGFNIITKLCYWFTGSEAYLLVFAVFAIATVFIFLLAMYKDSKEFFMTFFLFMAFGYYFQSLNTVRYYLALALVLYSMGFVMDRKYVRFIIIVLIATCFHKTAIVAIPIFILARLEYKRWMYGIIALAGISGLIFKSQYMKLFLKIYPTYVNEKENLMSGSATLINVLRTMAVLILAILLYRKCVVNKENNFYFNLNFFALILYSCFSFVPYLSRIGYYLTISQIYFIPNLLMSVSKVTGFGRFKLYKVLRVVVYAAGILFFAVFLYKAGSEGIRILPYSTWLSKDISFIKVYEYSFWELW